MTNNNVSMVEQVILCEKFLSYCDKTNPRGKPHRVSTYGWKHVVEKMNDTYISEEAFLKACENLNFHVKKAKTTLGGHCMAVCLEFPGGRMIG